MLYKWLFLKGFNGIGDRFRTHQIGVWQNFFTIILYRKPLSTLKIAQEVPLKKIRSKRGKAQQPKEQAYLSPWTK